MERIKTVKLKEFKELLNMKEAPPQTEKVMNTFYHLLGHEEKHTIVNYQQMVICGMIQIPRSLVDFPIVNLKHEQVLVAEDSLDEINEDSLKKESHVAHKIFLWINSILQNFHDRFDSEIKDYLKLDAKQKKESIKAHSQTENVDMRLVKAKRTPIARSGNIQNSETVEETKEIHATSVEKVVETQPEISLAEKTPKCREVPPQPESNSYLWEELILDEDKEAFTGPDKMELLQEAFTKAEETIQNLDIPSIKELRCLRAPAEVCIKVCGSVLVAFKKKDLSWDSVRKFLSAPDMKQYLRKCDHENMSYPKQCKKIYGLIKGLSEGKVASVSLAALGLFKWVKGMLYSRIYTALKNNESIDVRKSVVRKKSAARNNPRPKTASVSASKREEIKISTRILQKSPIRVKDAAKRTSSRKTPKKPKGTWKDILLVSNIEEIEGPEGLEILKEKIGQESLKLSKADIVEIKSMPNPPVVVSQVLSGLLAIFGEKDHSWKKIKSFLSQFNLLTKLAHFDKDHVEYTNCKKAYALIKDLNPEMVANVSKGALGIYSWIRSIINFRVFIALSNNESVPERKGCGLKKNASKKRFNPSYKFSPGMSDSQRHNQSLDSASIPSNMGNNSFTQSAYEYNKQLEDVKNDIEKRYTYVHDKASMGQDWRLFREDSPIRRKIMQNCSPDKKSVEQINRNSVTSSTKVINKAQNDPLYSSFSYSKEGDLDMSYSRHKQDIDIDTAIQKERMKPSNIKKTQSRVSYHWSPKRRREMKQEGEIMTIYYTEKFIKDVIKDISEKKITATEGEDYLKDFGYDMHMDKNPETGEEEITVSKITEEAQPPAETDEAKAKEERVLNKEFSLGKDLIREAANHITEESLRDLVADNDLSPADQSIIKTFIGLLELINHGKPKEYLAWHRIQTSLSFTEDWINRIDDFETMIEHYTFPQELINGYKEEFKRHAQLSSDKAYVSNLREYLCEAFCLLDILEEIKLNKSHKTASKSPAKFEKINERSHKNKDSKPVAQKKTVQRKSGEKTVKKAEKKVQSASSGHNPVVVTKNIKSMEIVKESSKEESPQYFTQKIRLQEEEVPAQDKEEERRTREARRRVVESRSPNKKVTTKTWSKGGATFTTKTTEYKLAKSPATAKSPKRKIVQKKRRGADSPTKRIIDHKNASLKHKKNAKKVADQGHMLYTIDPKNAYLVSNDFSKHLSQDQIIDKAMNERKGFTEKYIDEDGAQVTKYYYSSPKSYKLNKRGKVSEATKKFEVSPDKYVDAQEFFESSKIDHIVSDSSFKTRKDYIKEIEERTKALDDEINKDSLRSKYIRESS
ncbi:unnamed protein product [Moneuplotes crassus]|uniref:Uncharacterized protein n=1 Tax=Euplotes crassus TaxID=5936 RepID=A0AAD1U4D2_EUPCR|nr:unnamed protein product [Moneuplotes crassus]